MSQIKTFCSVSGGSITNGVLATRWNRLKGSVENGVFTQFDELLAKPLYEFCKKDLRTTVLLWDRANPVWSASYLVASLAWFVWMLWQFPTLERAIAKNGSISAYAFCGTNLGLYTSVLLFLLVGTLIWLWRCIRWKPNERDVA